MTDTRIAAGGMPYTPAADAPDWFLANLHQPGQSRRLDYRDGSLHYLTWNWDRRQLPTLLLVHGFCGHARWWSYLAPFFRDRFRVAALDLPGMGDSSALPVYDDDCFAAAIVALASDCGPEPVTLVGHSFGGVQSIRALAMQPALFSHGIVVDSLLRFPPTPRTPVIDGRPQHKLRASQAECLAHFRLSPPQPNAIEALVRYIGYHSCIGDGQGWHWKFDPRIRNFGEINDPAIMAAVPVPVDCLYATLSLFNRDDLPRRVLESFPRGGRLLMVADAYHHLMVDRPLALVEALNTLLDARR